MEIVISNIYRKGNVQILLKIFSLTLLHSEENDSHKEKELRLSFILSCVLECLLLLFSKDLRLC